MASPRPLRVVHVVATPSGAPWMVAMLREQQRLGYDVAAIVPSLDGDIAPRLAKWKIPCHAAGVDVLYAVPSLPGKVLTLFRLVRLLRRLRPDVVHSHIINSVVTMRLAAWLADVPVHLGGNVHPISLESDVLRPIEIGTAFCDAVSVASCTYTHELMLAHGLPPERVRMIHYAVDQSDHDPERADGLRVRRELGISHDAPVVGKIAYFYPPANSTAILPPPLRGRGVKGHDVLIRAVPLVLREIPDAKFILVGRGWGPAGTRYEEELTELVRSLGVSDAVVFTGERRDVPDVLAAFDVSVHCSLSDNLAGTVETLLMQKPMVVSDIRGFADTVLHEKTGLVVPKDDPAALAAAIVRLFRDRTLAQTLAAAGRLHAARFTLARTMQDLEELLASRPERAERHYRLATTMKRALTLPMRLLPVAREVTRVLKREGVTLRRLAKHRAWRVADRLGLIRLRRALRG